MVAVHPESQPLTYWADGLPAGATFDPATRAFSWLPGYESAGTYDVRFFVTDGLSRDEVVVTLFVAERNEPPQVVPVADRIAREGDFVNFRINASSRSDRELSYGAETLPFGATLNPTTGEFSWTPNYIQNGVYDIAFFVTDGETLVRFVTKITVENANAAPVFDQLDGWQVLEGQQLAFNIFAFDPDNPYYTPALRNGETGEAVETSETSRTVTVELIGDLPPGATFDPDTYDFTWTPTNVQAGDHVVHFRATDDGNGTGVPLTTDIIVPISVFNQNRRPVVSPIENATVAKDAVLEIPVSATDADGNPLVLALRNESPFRPLPDFITFVDNGDGTGKIRVAPGANARGDHVVILTATDDGDGTGEPLAGGYAFTIKVTSPNEAPEIGYIGDVVAVIGETMKVIVNVTDMDQDALTYAVAGLPGATITPTSVYGRALIEWTPTLAQAGTHDALVTVTDSGSGAVTPVSDTAAFKVVVRATNTAPQLAPVGNHSITEGETLSFTLGGADADNDSLTFTMSGAPDTASLDPATGAFVWTPPLNSSGEYSITFSVSDGHSSSSETIILTVANANQAPVFVPMGLQLAREGAPMVFRIIAGDPDADPVIYQAPNGLPEGMLFIPARGEIQWTPGYAQAGDHILRFTATDPLGAVDTIDVTVRVANVNRLPVLDEGFHAFLIGEEKRFTVRASDPDSEDVLTFSAEDLPEGATFDAVTGEFVWTPGPGQAGDYAVTLIADDGRAKVRQTILLRATIEPVPPVVRLELTPSFPAAPGQNVLIHAVADSLADITSLRVQLDGQDVLLDANGRATVVAGAPGKYVFTVTARDADGGEKTITQSFKVRDPLDKNAPSVLFDGAIDDAIVTSTLAIAGTVDDSNLDRWTLQLIDGQGDVTLLGEGGSNLTGTLATLDGRSLADGFYRLRLTATDISGRTSVDTAMIELRTGADKLSRYTTQHVDISTVLGGVPFDLVRAYDSITGKWTFLGIDADIVTSVGTQPNAGGALPAFEIGTRLFLTLPTGERAGFTFNPVEEVIGGQTFYRPAWIADGAHGWQFSSIDVQLRKIGGKFYDVDSGAAYNPGSPSFGDRDYALRAPDGTIYILDSQRGTVEIQKAEGKLLIGDSGITALGGDALRFLQDARGNVTQVTDASGKASIYSWDEDNRLTALRDLVTGAGIRYGYVDGRLALEVPSSGTGKRIVYAPDGTVATEAIVADLATPAKFTGQTISGDLGAGGAASFAFTLRETELEGLPNAFVILRVETTGSVTPQIAGLSPLASAQAGGKVVTLFALSTSGLHELRIAGSGAYAFEMRAAGDINGDAKVDGLDSAAVVAALAGSDISGDGVTNATDTQIVAANYGFRANQSPLIAPTIPTEKTHVDLQRYVDLTKLATDPDGDRLYFRVVGATGGSAALAADGRGVLFTPTAGYSGAASIRFSADDGFGSSAEGVIDINVSDAALLSLNFAQRQPAFAAAGESGGVAVIGQFADQADVALPYSYVTASVGHPDIVRLGSDGTLLALAQGATYLKVSRGNIAAATSLTVGDPNSVRELMTQIYGINAYPDSVTLLPDGGSRAIITSLDVTEETFANGAAAGTVYVSADSAIVTVDENGLMRGVGAGSTFVTVINGFSEDRVMVSVAPPVIGDDVAVNGAAGAIVQNADGVQIAFGPGALSGDATVTIDTLTEAELPIVMPATDAFHFLSAFDLQVDGAEFNDTVQIAVPVAGNVGDQVWFFASVDLPLGPNGETIPVWTVIDSGVIDADGMARAKSPPFPGLSRRGSVLVAGAAKPLPILRLNVGFTALNALVFAPAIGIAAVGGLAGATVALGLAGAALGSVALPLFAQLKEIQIYADLAKDQAAVRRIDLSPEFTQAELNDGKTIVANFPPQAFQSDKGPVVSSVSTLVANDGSTAVTITGLDFIDGEAGSISAKRDNVRVVLTHGSKRVVISDAVITGEVGGVQQLKFTAPPTVLLGASDVTIVRPAVGSFGSASGEPNDFTELVESAVVKIDNKAGYAFVGDANGVQIIDRKLSFEETQPNDELIARIDLGAPVREIVVTGDLGAAFVATEKGIAVIDTLTLRQYDLNPNSNDDFIKVEGGVVTALAVDTENGYLYAAGLGKVYVINIDPGRDNYLKVVGDPQHTLNMEITSRGEQFGHITSMALNADGTRLYVGLPVSEMFGQRPWINNQNSDPGLIMVVNVNEEQRPVEGEANIHGWRTVVDKVASGIEVFDIQPTVDPNKMVFVARGDRNRGAKLLEYTPAGTHIVTQIGTLTMGQEIGVFEQPFTIGGLVVSVDKKRSTDEGRFSLGRVPDLNVHNASGIAVTPDLEYMFVADWGVPTLYWYRDLDYSQLVDEFYRVGSKILVIKDPFGPNRQLVGATTPVPFAFLEELRVDSSGTKLYANYRGAGNIVIMDINKVRDIAKRSDFDKLLVEFQDKAIDNPNYPFDIYNESTGQGAVDVTRHGRGLALNAIQALNLITPTTELDIHGDNPPPLTFKWEFDPTLMPAGSVMKTSFYLSSLAPGDGLWPDDPIRERGVLQQPDWQGADKHPSRIFTKVNLEAGKWRVLASGEVVPDGELPPGKFELTFDPEFARVLTGGQTYFWGVRSTEFGIRDFRQFTVLPDKAPAGTFNGVTVLTHGFQLDGIWTDNDSFHQPAAFQEMGEMISRLGGGGIVLLYDKNKGTWADMSDPTRVVTGDMLAAYAGKPVVLISDWVRESAHAEAGFSEAAADSLFAALMDLDAESNNTLLSSPLHFIGHSRGTVVNSEIIQRLGYYGRVTSGIHMTTLDPHDFVQDSLDIPVNTLLNIAKAYSSFKSLALAVRSVATAVGAVGSAVGSGGLTLVATGAILGGVGKGMVEAAGAAKMAFRIQKFQDLAQTLGIQLDPVKFGDFLDPDVKLWSNVSFSDNYYQDAASQTFTTATPNGRDIGPTDISRYLGGVVPGVSGFNLDDFAGLGAGGPHSRVWQWYAGTIDTNMTKFQGLDIYRRITDDGIRPKVFGIPSLDQWNMEPWYFVDPGKVTSSSMSVRIGAANQMVTGNTTSTTHFNITDGVGTGWFYSVAGGGADFRPIISGGEVDVTTDNSEAPNPGGSAVQSIFNGNFEQGTRESLNVHLERIATGELDDDAGRFPISYEIPGFAFHGGQGFKLDLLGLPDADAIGNIDVAALFMVNTNPQALVKKVLVKIWEDFFDSQVNLANQITIGNFKLPTLNFVEAKLAAKVVGWAGFDAGKKIDMVNKYFKATNKVFKAAGIATEALNDGLNTLVESTGVTMSLGADTQDKAGLDRLKDYVSKAIENGFDKLFPNEDNYSLIMGASAALTKIIDSFLPDGDIWEAIKMETRRILPGLDSITHNFVYVPKDEPYLTFKIYKPYMLQPGAKIRVRFEGAGLPTIDALVANQEAGARQVDLGTGMFTSSEFSVIVPDEYKGRSATITITHENMAPTEEDKQDLEDAAFIDAITDAAKDLGTAVSQIYLLDDLRFTTVAAINGVMPGSPQVAAEGVAITPAAPAVTLEQLASLVDDARLAWIAAGISDSDAQKLADLEFAVTDHQGAALAVHSGHVITIDADGAGHGWFIDITPDGSSEFLTSGGRMLAIDGSAAAGRYDLLTVLIHEMGHELGLSELPTTTIGRVMNEALGLGERRLPGLADLPVVPVAAPVAGAVRTVTLKGTGNSALAAVAAAPFALLPSGTPATAPFQNGDFGTATGWSPVGGGVVSGGVGVLAEDSRFLSSLNQKFVLPNGATEISFQIRSAVLGSNNALPPDAFEVALLDPVTGQSLLGDLDGLDLSDALLNLQADGSLYLAPGVTVTGNPLTGSATVTVSLAGVDRSNGALLSFDLIAMGDLDSRVTIDNVAFVAVANNAPVATNDSGSGDEDQDILIDLLANDSDADGDLLSIAILSGPANGTLIPPTVTGGAWTYRPDANFAGADSFTYSITDGLSAPVSASVAITVNAVNDLPELAVVQDRSAVQGSFVTLNLLGSDVEDVASGLTYALVSGPAGASVNPSGLLSWTAGLPGIENFTVSVTDSDGGIAERSFAITVVAPGNEAPVFAALPDRDVNAGSLFTLQLAASDDDDAAADLTYTLIAGPSGATLSPAGELRWVATGSGPRQVTVRVTDPKGAFDQRSFALNVVPVIGNTAPTLPVLGDVAVESGKLLILPITASDNEDVAEALTYSLVSGPDGAAISASGLFSWQAGNPGSQTVTVRVTDTGGLIVERSFAIQVSNPAPIFAPIADRSVSTGGTVAITLSAIDSNHGAAQLVYSLVSGPTGASVTSDGQFSWTAAGLGAQPVVVRVTDPLGASAETGFNIEVTNVAPVLADVGPVAVNEGSVLSLQLVASDTEDAAADLTYTLIAGPSGATLSPTGELRWVAAGTGSQTVTVRVTDTGGLIAERSFAIQVSNPAPIFAPIADRSVQTGGNVVITLSATDSNHGAAQLVYSLVSGPAGASVTSDGQFSWTAAGLGAQPVVVRVTDPLGASAETGFNIEVTNVAPVLAAVGPVTVNEGSMLSLQLVASDADDATGDLLFSLVSGPAGATLTAGGLLNWRPVDGGAEAAFTVRVTDPHGAQVEQSFNVAVADVAPVLSVFGLTTILTGKTYTIALGSSDPGDDRPIEWVIDWGDGTTPTSVEGSASAASHIYAEDGNFLVSARLRNDDGSFSATPLGVVVNDPPLLRLTQAGFTDGGLVVRVSEPLDALAGSQAVQLTDGNGNSLALTLGLATDGLGFTLTRADGKPLQYGSYDLVIADGAFISADGSVLDGDNNGLVGGVYRTRLTFSQSMAGSARLPDFMRGPGEHVDVPLADNAGLKVSFASQGGVKTMTFTVLYDPALLRVDGVLPGADLPAGASLGFVTEAAAGGKRLARISVSSDTPIAAGDRWILSLDATVPDTAPYGSSEVLEVKVEAINAAAPSATEDDQALQLVGYYGDANADRRQTMADLWLATRVALNIDKGFVAWGDAPPALVADIRDHRPLANPLLPDIESIPVKPAPLWQSQVVLPPDFGPITYGFYDAVDRWAQDIRATDSAWYEVGMDGKKQDQSDATAPAPATGSDTPPSPASTPAPVAPVPTASGPVDDAVTAAAVARAAPVQPKINMNAQPVASRMIAAMTDADDQCATWLSRFLLDNGDSPACSTTDDFLPILIPGLNQPREKAGDKRRRDAMRTSEGPSGELEKSE
ncbi:putative Ig domain-containing protein [uncultured Sphingobium sp.]|uniref:Ig-like domain-containing protein n=1 Tax=uncultured Sphingobium sp. TaxID=316087 RepID=UPI00338E36DC